VEPEHPAPETPESPDRSPLAGPDPDATESEVIGSFLATRAPAPAWVTVDAGHDCAVIYGDHALKVDTVVGGVHFDDRWRPAEVGWKAVAAVISDLGAAGAEPRWLLVSVSTPDPAWASAVAEGVGAACRRFGAYLVGGDVTRAPRGAPASVSVSGGGRCVGRPLTRSGARPGDDLWVTGTVGLAGLGWSVAEPPAAALAALRHPEPPLAFALALARDGLATAAMDLSDGPRSDLPRLARASGVHLRVDARSLPLAPEVAGRGDALRLALCGGDDHQLLFAAPADRAVEVEARGAERGVRVTRIGRVLAGEGVSLAGAAWPAPLFAHFGGAA
jgi:thiamine-monophosphate kinase